MNLSHDIVAFYRGWRRFEERRSRFHGLWVVIDDLAETPVKPRSFDSLRAIDDDLARLIDATEVTHDLLLAHKALTRDRLRQSQSYLRQKPGARVTREDVLSRGLRWEHVSDDELRRLRDDYLGLRRELVDARLTTEDDLTRYQAEGRGSMALAMEIRDVGLKGLDAVRRAWKWLPPVTCDVETETSDGAWRNIVTTGERGLKLILNDGPHATFSAALTEFLGLHEIAGHVGHFSYLKGRSELQEQAPHLLQLVIHGQDAYYAEGAGQFLSEVACELLYGRMSLQNLELRRVDYMLALRNQNIMGVIEGDRTVDEAVQAHLAALGGDPSVLKGQYAAYTSDPFFCCQVLVFYPSLKALKPALALSADRLSAFAQELLSLGMGPAAIDDLVAKYV